MRDRDRVGLRPGGRHRGHSGQGGARIVVNYSSSTKEAEQTADLCRNAGAEVVVVQGDVSRDEDCKKIVGSRRALGPA